MNASAQAASTMTMVTITNSTARADDAASRALSSTSVPPAIETRVDLSPVATSARPSRSRAKDRIAASADSKEIRLRSRPTVQTAVVEPGRTRSTRSSVGTRSGPNTVGASPSSSISAP